MIQNLIAYTLVDVTDTNVVRVCVSNTKEYHQQQNLNVLLQTIGLRTQPLDPVVIKHHNVPLTNMNFSPFYGDGPANVWSIKFHIDHLRVWDDGEDELGFLKTDAHGVAITSDLDNNVEFIINIFDTQDNVNLYFEIS